MLRASARVSDLIFSPGTLPHIEVSGHLVPVKITGLAALTPEDTRRIAEELIAGNQQALTALREQGSCDISFSLPGECRFRVNVFVQRGSHAIVMRVIPKSIPTFAELKLPRATGRNRQTEERHRADHRPHRLGKVFHHGGGSRQDQ